MLVGGKALTAWSLLFGVFFFDSCVEITALEVSLILWEVKGLSWPVLPHRREYKFGKMRLTEYNAQKKETASAWGRWGVICRWTWYGIQNDGGFQVFYPSQFP